VILALTRGVPPAIERCELTHLARARIDVARAAVQHQAYEAALVEAGCTVQRLPDAPEMPDSVFVEDAAVVFDGLAVIARPGASSRREEVTAVAAALRPHRPLAFIEEPGTLDGGDVLVIGTQVFVGMSGRTNSEGARQLAIQAAPLGLRVVPVPVTGCLHLKSAVTLVTDPADRPRLLINRAWLDPKHFNGFDLIDVDPAEPWAANVLRVGTRVVCAAEHPRTGRRLAAAGFATLPVPAGELAKAEAGVTCCSILVSLQRPQSFIS
jgi:dimethylargininase